MNAATRTFSAACSEALSDFVADPDEAGLARAYDLGREALRDGIGPLALAEAYCTALAHVVARTPAEKLAATLDSAPPFLAEAISPFEMAHRGVRQALDGERAAMTAIMASMSDGLVVLGPTGSVDYCNTRAGELLGIHEGMGGSDGHAALGHAPALDASARAALCGACDAVAGGSAERVRCELDAPGPPARHLVAQVFRVVTESGSDRGVGVLVHDRTAEQELAQAKDELLAIATHELRSPLAAILGFANLLSDGGLERENAAECVGIIRSEASRLVALVSDFLDVQRIARGDTAGEARPFDLAASIDQAAAVVGVDRERPIVVRSPQEPLWGRGDPDAVLRVLVNLVSNARKYSPEGGDIDVTVLRDGDLLTVSVRDRGLGMTPEVAERAFDEFYRAPDPLVATIAGTGLGLAICRKLVDAWGGRIWAQSAGPGRGTCVSFTLPAAEAPE